jgi:hypothetical protein
MGISMGLNFEVMETLESIKPARVHLFFSLSFFLFAGHNFN